ncbi:MAG TPA: DHA2 family efflux MFS transporter permease subunit [Xanthobacteraceae bacterium]|nr:DHA2 family efflux MFS transporter permease subunit [Xanthobacteraceae bacterium]
MLTVCAMSATIMQALDTTVANVVMPYMQGSLSASIDQVNWVLTSYIVASAIFTAPVGWLASRFGRKRLFLACTLGFTVASVLCGLAQNIEQMVLFRLFQGIFGAGLIPLSQAVMLDAYPVEERGMAMSIWGMGIMLGPIMGPTIGGWLTETYSWHWVFLINFPVGILTLAGLIIFLDESTPQTNLRFDWIGFAALTVGIGSLQLVFDRGEQLGWLESPEIVAELIIGVAGFYYFFAHSLTTREQFIKFELFKDRNFAGSCIFMAVLGLTVFSTMALSTLYLQNVLLYPVWSAGLMLAARGFGTMTGMMVVGRLLKYFEARNIMLVGMVTATITMYQMVYFTNMTSATTIIIVTCIQGLGLGLVFVPLNIVSFATLPPHLRTDGASILTLIRNIGSSAGIPIVIAVLVNSTGVNRAQIIESITPFNDPLRAPDVARTLDMATDTGRALLDNIVNQQAMIIGFSNAFKLLTILTLISIPLLFILGSSRLPRQAVARPVPAE